MKRRFHGFDRFGVVRFVGHLRHVLSVNDRAFAVDGEQRTGQQAEFAHMNTVSLATGAALAIAGRDDAVNSLDIAETLPSEWQVDARALRGRRDLCNCRYGHVYGHTGRADKPQTDKRPVCWTS